MEIPQMAHIPTTSTTLLRDLAGDAGHARWSEFVARYRPMMEAFLHEHFQGMETDDVVQETFVALVKTLPKYRYDPKETGFFHNYLTGILRHKALRKCEKSRQYAKTLNSYASQCLPEDSGAAAQGTADWKKAIYEIALQQLLADDAIQQRTKEIFVHVAIDGEKPEAVASAFGVQRNTVDQIRCRMITKLRALVAALEAIDG
jgi:RNA polymerase sigma factor (sigma-70 family)